MSLDGIVNVWLQKMKMNFKMMFAGQKFQVISKFSSYYMIHCAREIIMYENILEHRRKNLPLINFCEVECFKSSNASTS